MMLPAAIFTGALREVEEQQPFLSRIMVLKAGPDDGFTKEVHESAKAHAEEEFLKAMRAECARRGWVQLDVADPGSWEFHEVAGFDNTSSGPVRRPTTE